MQRLLFQRRSHSQVLRVRTSVYSSSPCPYLQGIHSKTLSGCLKPRIVQNPMDSMLYPASLLLRFGAITKIRVTWTQALTQHDGWTDNWDSFKVTGRILRTKVWFTSLVGWRGPAWDFITLLRHTIYNLWIAYFWNFPFNIFRPRLTPGNWNLRNQNRG